MKRWKYNTIRLLMVMVLAVSAGGCVDNLLAGIAVTVTQTFAATLSAALASAVAGNLVGTTGV